MWGTLAATLATTAATTVGSIIKSRNANKTNDENQSSLDADRAANQAYYDKNYYADATQLADNRALLTEAKNNLTRNSSAIAGRNAVNGGTNATAAAAKEAANEAYASAVRGVAANAQQQKQHVQDSYRTQAANISNQQRAFNTARNDANAAAIDAAVQGVGNVASSFVAGNTSSSNTGNTAGNANSGTTPSTNNDSYNPANDPNIIGGSKNGR